MGVKKMKNKEIHKSITKFSEIDASYFGPKVLSAIQDSNSRN